MNLLDAVKSKDASIVRSLLNQGHSSNGNLNFSEEKHPLDLAIELNSLEIVSLLIEHGIDLESPIHPLEKQIALHRAVMCGNKNIIMKILERTVNWQATDSKGATVLHLALESKEDNKIEITKLFLDLGMNVDVRNLKEETPLFVACKYKLWSVADFLIEQGADINVQDCNDDSIVHYFMKCKGERLCLNEHAGRYVNFKAEFMKRFLGRGGVVDCKNKAGQSPLQLAINNNLLSAILILLKYVKDSSCFASQENQTILHSILQLNINRFCCNKKHHDPQKVSQIDAVVKILLDRQFPIDGLDGSGNTVLHVAAREKKFFVLPKCLEHLKDVNARNDCGETALHVILSTSDVDEKGLEDAVVAMLSKGASMSLVNNYGLSAVHLAAKKKHVSILQLFKAMGVDLKISTATGENLWHLLASNCSDASKNQDMIELLADEGLDVNATTLDGSTPLHLALECSNDLSIYKALMVNGADVNSRDESSQMMPIHIAAQNNDECALWHLLRAGADPNAKVFETSVLHLAARHPASYHIIKDLIGAGADLDAVDDDGHPPVHYVLENENLIALAYLLELDLDIADCCDAHCEFLAKLRVNFVSLREHSVKLQCLDLPASDVDATSNFGTETALAEVRRMKALRINRETSLYNFLRMSLPRRMTYAEHENLTKIVNLPDLKTEFSMYHDVIMRKYREALVRTQLLVPAKLALARLAGVALPDLCVDIIFRDLKNHSLRLLIRILRLCE